MIWCNGELYDQGPIPLDPADRGLLLGDGVFETIAVFHGRPFRLVQHLEALEDAAAALGFALPRATVERAVADLVAGLAGGHGALRITVTRGAGPRGLAPPAEPAPVVLATTAPWSEAMAFQPIRLATVSIRRNPTSPLSRIKSLAYLDNVLAFQAARAAGADDALMLNTEGRVASTSMANLFLLRDGRLLTPPVEDGVRPGIMRELLLDCGAVEASLMPEDLAAGAVFATNSLRLLQPVTAIDGRASAPVPAEVIARLRAACGL